MLNVFQIDEAIDSIKNEVDKINLNFIASIKNEHSFFQAKNIKEITTNTDGNQQLFNPISETIYLDSLTKEEKIVALSSIPSNLRRINQNLHGQI